MIFSFKGENRWLSNFWLLENPLIYNGIRYATTEHFYQAMKSNDRDVNLFISSHPLKGLKKASRYIAARSDWDDVKLDVMLYAIRYKFSKANPSLMKRLIDTGDCYIEEGNYWGDVFWGVDIKSREGQNNLGKIIMKVRDEINVNDIQSK